MRLVHHVQLRLSPLALCAVLWTIPTGLNAQEQAVAPLSASLLRRLAEAVDGDRSGSSVWVVIQQSAPYTVKGVFTDADKARAVATASLGYLALGPYAAPPDSGLTTVMYAVLPCPGKHDIYSGCITGDSTGGGSAVAVMAAPDVDSLSVTLFGKSGARIHRSFGPTEVDALFFTLPAIDKFVIPYYTRLFGPDVAAAMRRNYLRQVAGTRPVR